jgi:hypothetical protein
MIHFLKKIVLLSFLFLVFTSDGFCLNTIINSGTDKYTKTENHLTLANFLCNSFAENEETSETYRILESVFIEIPNNNYNSLIKYSIKTIKRLSNFYYLDILLLNNVLLI